MSVEEPAKPASRMLWPALLALAAFSGWILYRRAASPPQARTAAASDGAPVAAPDGASVAMPDDAPPAEPPTTLTMTSPRQEGALDFYSSEAGAIYMKGVDAANKGDQEGAIRHFGAAIAKAPLRAEPYHDRALAYEVQGKRELALADYDRAIALNADDPSNHFLRGVLLVNLGRLDAARADAEALEKLDPAAAASLKSYLQGR